jgi:AcrR family transcriptional regulator
MRTRSETKIAAGEAENSCETRRAILSAAQTRFLHYGFKKTTIDEIAQDAGVGKGTVYLHFESKDDILQTLVRTVKRNVTEQMRAIAQSPLISSEEKLRRMLVSPILSVHDACTASAHGVELVDEAMQPNVIRCTDDERTAQRVLIADVLREGMRRGDFTVPEDDADLAARHLMLAMISFFPPSLNPCHAEVKCRGTLETSVNKMIGFLMHGVISR